MIGGNALKRYDSVYKYQMDSQGMVNLTSMYRLKAGRVNAGAIIIAERYLYAMFGENCRLVEFMDLKGNLGF